MNKQDYIARLKLTIEHLHDYSATWRGSELIREDFKGKVLWQGVVEAFDLTGHPKAKLCYGWTHGEPEEFITILELPPVTDAQSAVKVGVSYQIKKARGK